MSIEVYEKEYTILSSDVDFSRRLKLSVLYKMLQEAAIAHTTELGMGREKTLDKGLLWIITMQQTSVKRLPEYDEKIVLRSWPGDTMHMFFPRFYRMEDAHGEELLTSSMLWALMDEKTRNMVFPDEHGIKIDSSSFSPSLPIPKRVAMPELELRADFIVPYSYTDINGHMNNTRYFDLVLDNASADLRDKNISDIFSEYVAEIACGEKISLFMSESPCEVFTEGRFSDGRPCFRMVLKTS